MSDIMKVFWSNVDWHRKNKKCNWADLIGSREINIEKGVYPNVSLKKIQSIAEDLNIDDYAILFEELEN